MRSRRHAGRQRTRFAIALVAAFLVAAEITARIDDRIRLQIPLSAVPDHDRDLILQDALGIRGKPNGRFKKWRLNSFGFRRGEMALLPPARCTRVLVLGASETFGMYESEGHEYPAELAGLLDRAGCYEVVNAAIAGLTVRGITQFWNNWASQFEPAVVVVYPTPAFYLANNAPGVPQTGDGPSTPSLAWWTPRLLDRAHNVLHYPALIQRRRVERWLVAARTGHDASWFFNTVPQARVDQFLNDVDTLLTAVVKRGATPLLVTHATAFRRPPRADEADELAALNAKVPRAAAPVLLEFEDRTARGLRDFGLSRGIGVVDAASVMNGHHEWFAEDFIHFNNEGAAIMARLLAEQILAQPQKPSRVVAQAVHAFQ